MNRRPRQRPLHKLRFAMMLAFALGLVAQSLFGTLGDTHRLAAHADASHAFADHLVPHDHERPGSDTDPGESGSLHVLFHHVHCCVHAAWITGGEISRGRLAMISTPLPGDAARHVPSSTRTAPFRPPIPA